jgi:hypothetical protein
MAANTALRNSPSNPYFTKNGFSSMGLRKSISTNWMVFILVIELTEFKI